TVLPHVNNMPAKVADASHGLVRETHPVLTRTPLLTGLRETSSLPIRVARSWSRHRSISGSGFQGCCRELEAWPWLVICCLCQVSSCVVLSPHAHGPDSLSTRPLAF